MKKMILICMSLIILAGCTSNADMVFRDRIVTDFEQIFASDSEVFKAYANAVSEAKELAKNPTQENKERFTEAASKSYRTAKENSEPVSRIGDDEYAVMDKLNLTRTDYEYLFNAQTSSMAELSGWTNIAEQFEEDGDVQALIHNISIQENKLELEKVFLIYGAMDWVVDTTKDNAKCFKDMIYKYPDIIPEDCEWLTDHDEILSAYNLKLDEIEEHINEEQEYINQQTQKLRQMQSENN